MRKRKIIYYTVWFIALFFAIACNENAARTDNTKEEPGSTVTDKYEKKKKEGIDFVAVGDQPAWELDIDLQKAIWFTTLEENTTALTTPVPQAIKGNDGNTITYEATVDAGSIKAIITHQPCINSSTGETFDYDVEVQTSGKTFRGCGKYLN